MEIRNMSSGILLCWDKHKGINNKGIYFTIIVIFHYGRLKTIYVFHSLINHFYNNFNYEYVCRKCNFPLNHRNYTSYKIVDSQDDVKQKQPFLYILLNLTILTTNLSSKVDIICRPILAQNYNRIKLIYLLCWGKHRRIEQFIARIPLWHSYLFYVHLFWQLKALGSLTNHSNNHLKKEYILPL